MNKVIDIAAMRGRTADPPAPQVQAFAALAADDAGALAPPVLAPGAHDVKPHPHAGGEATAPAIAGDAIGLSALPGRQPPTPVRAWDFRSIAAAIGGHAVLIVALFYMASAAGFLGDHPETPVEIEIIVEPAAPAIERAISINLPPPLPEPIIDPPPPEPEPLPERKIAIDLPPPLPLPIFEPPPPEPEKPQPKPLPEPKIAIDLPPPLPLPVFEPPPEAKSEPALEVAKPEAPAPDLERKRQEADKARERERQRRVREQRDLAQEKARLEKIRERQREAARLKAQKDRAEAQRRADQSAARQAAAAHAAPAGNPNSIAAFKIAVAAKIARNKPSSSTAEQAQGTVVIAFSVTPSGAAAGIRITRSSGHGVLDNAALAAVRRASPFPPPPPGAPRSFSIPMRFNALR